MDLAPKGYLFGHRAPVTALALSRSFSTLLSVSSDGTVISWDLNRREIVRVIAEGHPIDVSSQETPDVRKVIRKMSAADPANVS